MLKLDLKAKKEEIDVAITDLTADMLTMIRNASSAHKETVEIKCSKFLEAICEILKHEGFISNYKKIEDEKQGMIKVYLKYGKTNMPAITGIKKVTRPGLRAYKGYRDISLIFGGIGMSIISTSQGMMTSKDARAKKVGGEVVCHVW
jgi:small subunit ribosomal protein S8